MPGLDLAHRATDRPSRACTMRRPRSRTRRPPSRAAIAAGYGIECDLQVSADGEAMVHHDDALGRLTEGSGKLAEMSAAAIKKARFKQSSDRILTLGELCELVAGRATLVLELKSHFDGDRRLVERAAGGARELQRAGGGDVVRSGNGRDAPPHRPRLTRGIVAQRHYDDWRELPPSQRHSLGDLLHVPRTRPQFIAYRDQGPAGAGAACLALRLRPAAADLDGAHRGGPAARRALGRSDDFRGLAAVRRPKAGKGAPCHAAN